MEKIKENDGVVTGSVIEVVKGGLIVDIGLRGFLPASLIELRRVRDLTPYLGQEIEAKILELDKNRNNVVLSRRALLEQTQSESRTTFLNNLHKGQVRKGIVSSIVNFGAFVDLGGVDGLVHVSELSWKHIEHASEVVEVGQEVTVEILEVDLDRERVSLSLKATQEDPWQVFARTHAIGQVAPGKVTKLVPFGAFVRVADGIEGLVHISELSGKHVELAEQVVSVGEEVFVKVIDIDLERRRISLSLKQANESVDPNGTEFDPALYGMVTEYDENGEYKYPEGFDPETQRVARRLRRPAREVGAGVRRCPGVAGRRTRPPSPRPLEAEAATPRPRPSSASSSFSSEQLGRRHARRRRGARRSAREALGSLILAISSARTREGRHLRVAALSSCRRCDVGRRSVAFAACPQTTSPAGRGRMPRRGARRCVADPAVRAATSRSRRTGLARAYGVTDVLPSPCRLCGSRSGVRHPSGWVCAVCEWRHGELVDGELPPPRVDVVYYLRYADRVKIGTTSNPRQRFAAIRHDDVLAFERGDRRLERHRHAQFADERLRHARSGSSSPIVCATTSASSAAAWSPGMRMPDG